jgi:hypothetical protein
MSFQPYSSDVYDDGEYRLAHTLPHNRTNVLLVKNPLGKVKPTTRTLPSADFTYGYVEPFDAEGAKDVLSTWCQHQRNPAPAPKTNFVELNKQSAMQGCVNAKNVASFRKTYDVPMSEGTRAPYQNVYYPDQQTVYGMKSAPSAPLAALLTHSYGRASVHENRHTYTRRATQKRARQNKKLTQYTTQASLGHTKVAAPPPKPMFKLQQFRDVPSRVTLGQYAGATRRRAQTSDARLSSKRAPVAQPQT